MKKSIKNKGKKILATILCLITLMSTFLNNDKVLAWTSSEGVQCSSVVGEPYVSIDGGKYYFTKEVKAIIYDTDGNTSFKSFNRTRPLEKFYLIQDGVSVLAFCIEGGTSFKDSDNGYISENYNNSLFFNNLPYTAQYGIMVASLYGWRNDVPTELQGVCNLDDFRYAIQLIMWEYQQQIRTSPTSLETKNGIDWDMYYHSIQGRPAEQAYNWVLTQMANHLTIPSFCSRNEFNAPVHTMQYNVDTNNYSLTITDTNNTLADLKFDTNSNGISISRNGNQYTFTSSKEIMYTETITAEKNINQYNDQFLIWGREGFQTMATGSKDPVRFYLKINTEQKKGNLKVTKTSEDGIVENVKFHLYGNSINGVKVDEYAITNSEGIAEFNNVLVSGNNGYILEEVDTEIKYVVPSTQNVIINWNEVANYTINNVLKKFNVTVKKSDIENSEKQGNATLEGATYGIYKDGQLVDTYTTDSNGEFTTSYYICGDNWTIKEISPSEGYLLDETIYTIGAEPQKYTIEYNSIQQNVTEQVAKGKISIIKHTDNGDTQIETPEVGAEFEVYLKSSGSYENAKEIERDILICNEDGFSESKELPYGTYIVHQTSGWENSEFMKDFEVHITQDSKTYKYIINNKEFESYIKMVKVDKNTGKVVTLSNATFSLYKLNENTNKWDRVKCKIGKDIHTTWTTNNEGIAYTETKLKSGTYKLEEVQVPNGFLKLENEIIFEVSLSNDTIEYDEDNDAFITVNVENEQPTAKLIVEKTISTKNNVDKTLVDLSDFSNIQFRLTAKENIVDMSDGTIIYYKGEEIGRYKLDNNKKIEITGLRLGKYELEEISTLDGFLLDKTKYEVEFTQKDTTTKVYTEIKHIINESTIVEFSKIDATNGKELEGASLSVIDENGNVVDEWISTNKKHIIEGLTAGKTYTFREDLAPLGYQIAESITFTVATDKKTQVIEMKDKPILKIETGNATNYIVLVSIIVISTIILAIGSRILRKRR